MDESKYSTISYNHLHLGAYQIGQPYDPDYELRFSMIEGEGNVVWTSSIYDRVFPYSVNPNVEYIRHVGAHCVISDSGLSIWGQRPALF